MLDQTEHFTNIQNTGTPTTEWQELPMMMLNFELFTDFLKSLFTEMKYLKAELYLDCFASVV